MAEAGADFDATLIGNMGRKISQYSMEIVELRKRVQELQRGAVYSLVDEDNPHLKGLNVRLGDLEHERDALSVRLGELEKEKDDLNIRLREMEKEREGFKCDLEKSNVITTEARRERYAFENELRRVLEQKTKLEMDLLEAQEQVREKNVLREDLRRVLAEKIDLEKAIHEAEVQLKQKDVLHGDLQRVLAEKSELESTIKELEESITSLQTALDNCKSELFESNLDLHGLRKEKKAWEAAIALSTDRIRKLERENTKHNKGKAGLLSELDECIKELKALRRVNEEREKDRTTLDELVRQNGTLVEKREALSRQVLEQTSLAAKNAEAVLMAEATTTRLQEENESLSKEVADAVDLAKQKQDLLDRLEQELNLTRLQKESLREQELNTQEEVRVKDALVGDLENRLAETQRLNECLEVTVAKLCAELAAKSESMASAAKNAEQAHSDVPDCRAEHAEADRHAETDKQAEADTHAEVDKHAEADTHPEAPQRRPSSGVPSGERTRIFPLPTSYRSPIPDERLRALESLRSQAPPLDPTLQAPSFPDGVAHFTKRELKDSLGGGKSGIITKVSKHTHQRFPLSYLGITSYVCPRLDQNPWCPYAPGKDGYLFLGLAGDTTKLVSIPECALFVNTSDVPATHFFAGFYEISQVEALTVEEWNAIPDSVKHKIPCSPATKDKGGEEMSSMDLQTQYNTGARRTPCQRLRFISFRNPKDPSHDVYEALVTHFASQPVPLFTYKRKRDEEDTYSVTKSIRLR